MSNITIPKKLEQIVQAFYAESPKAAKKLVIQAAKAIYGAEEEKDPYDFFMRSRPITDEQLEDICAFMQGIQPRDMLEAIIVSQIVVTQMLGMRKFASGSAEDQRLGLKMLQFSGEAMGRLQKKRSGGMQHVTVNYNYNGLQPAIPVIPVEAYG